MSDDFSAGGTSGGAGGRRGPLRAVAAQGTRVASTALRPLQGAAGAVVDLGFELERRAVDRVLDSDELERVIVAAVASPRVQAAMQSALSSPATQSLVDSVLDSPMFDRLMNQLVDRLLAGDAVWRMIDEVAASPAVRAAVSQQGLGFADQVGSEVRRRSSRADDWLERAAQGLARRRPASAPQSPDPA